MKLPRRKALAVAGLAGLATLSVGSALLMAASGGAGTLLNAGSVASDATSVVTEVQYDDTFAVVADPPVANRSTVPASESAPAVAPASGPSVSGDGEVQPTSPVRTPVSATSSPSKSASGPEHESDQADESTTTTTTRPSTPPPTAVYPKDLPPGWEIPEGWPATKALPPIPAGCVLGQLEDNLIWNCEH
jgi:hypothetical protein